MTDRVLVTGGAGFIGSHVADQYLAEGYQVAVLDNLSGGSRDNVPHGAEFFELDVRSPEARELLETGGFAVVNHHAAQMDVRVSVADPGLDADINLMGIINLLEGARVGGAKRFVFASSGGVVYGEGDRLPHPETARKLPVSPYGVSKLASEYYLSAYALLYQMECVSLRYANVYGPRQSPHGEAGVVAIFGSRIKLGRPLTVFGDGEQTRDYVYVSDVARANLLATTWKTTSPHTVDTLALNVGTGVETSVNQLARLMLDASGSEVPLERAPARAGELARSSVDVSRAQDEIGWVPEIALEDGLGKTYQWLAEKVV